MKKILFVINGLGLGNSTRCHAILSELVRRGFQVKIATSGNGLNYFRSELPSYSLLKLEELQYGKIGNRVSLLLTLIKIPNKILGLFRNQLKIISLVKEQRINAIVIDSDYSLFPFGKFLNCKIIALNNSDYVLREVWRRKKVPFTILPQFLVEVSDYFFQQIMADHVLSPVFLPTKNTKNITHIPAVVRGAGSLVESRAPGNSGSLNVLIMLTGSTFYHDLDFLMQLPDSPKFHYMILGRDQHFSPRFHVLGKDFKNQSLIADADILIINAGFSAVSEAVFFRKPTIVIPVSGHSEQYVNGRMLEDLGFGLVACEKNLREKFDYLVENLDLYPKSSSLELSLINGVNIAVEKIQEIIT